MQNPLPALQHAKASLNRLSISSSLFSDRRSVHASGSKPTVSPDASSSAKLSRNFRSLTLLLVFLCSSFITLFRVMQEAQLYKAQMMEQMRKDEEDANAAKSSVATLFPWSLLPTNTQHRRPRDTSDPLRSEEPRIAVSSPSYPVSKITSNLQRTLLLVRTWQTGPSARQPQKPRGVSQRMEQRLPHLPAQLEIRTLMVSTCTLLRTPIPLEDATTTASRLPLLRDPAQRVTHRGRKQLRSSFIINQQ